MSLITPGDLQDLVQTDLSTDAIQGVIDREETELLFRFGPHSRIDGTTNPALVTERMEGGQASVFVDRPFDTVVAILVSSNGFIDSAVVNADGYRTFPDEGRIVRISGNWESEVEVRYFATDLDNVRKSALIDLCRIAIDRQAFRRESIAGEYSYTSPPNWEQERESIYGRLKPFAII